MVERDRVADADGAGDYVEFFATGTIAKGAYRCTECGYGVAVSAALPACPMCSGTTWEESAWSPFGRAGDLL